MARWTKQTHRLRDDHTWRSKPGYQIFVADRGAVRFDFPTDWVIVPDSNPISFYDRAPPDDECRLQLTVFRLPPGIDWSSLPLDSLLSDVLEGRPDDDDARDVLSRGGIITVEHHGLELAWTETHFIDVAEQRQAYSRTCLARGADVQILITCDFWRDDAARITPVWDEVLRSLRLGQYVANPRHGPHQ